MNKPLTRIQWLLLERKIQPQTNEPINMIKYKGCPNGFKRKGKKVVPDHPQLRSIHTIISLNQAGYPSSAIAETLQRIGVPNPRSASRLWTSQQVSSVLRRKPKSYPHANPLCMDEIMLVVQDVMEDNHQDASNVLWNLLNEGAMLSPQAQRFKCCLESEQKTGYQHWHQSFMGEVS